MKKDAATAEIPVIVLTSLSQKNEGKLRQAGAFAFLEKGPLLDNPQLLLGAIDLALNKSVNERPPEQFVPGSVPLR